MLLNTKYVNFKLKAPLNIGMITLLLINHIIGIKSNNVRKYDNSYDHLLPYSKKVQLHSKHKVLLLFALLISLFVFSILFLVLPFAEGLLVVNYNQSIGEGKTINHSSSFNPIQIHNFGAWMSNQIPIEALQSYDERKSAISSLLQQGYKEYIF